MVRCSGPFTDEASGDPVDPSVVVFAWKVAGGETTQYTYGVGDRIVKDSVGNYHVDLPTRGLPGMWSTLWASDGVGEAAGPLVFLVQPAPVEPVFS